MKNNITEQLFSQVEDGIEDCIGIIEAVAGNYFQMRFTEKSFDGKAWPPNKDPKRRGSELIKTNKLRSSYMSEPLPNGVRFSFGKKSVVDYARVHNEGFDGNVVIPAHTRKTKKGVQNVREHTRHMRIPRRQFLGRAQELEKTLHDEMEAYMSAQLNRK